MCASWRRVKSMAALGRASPSSIWWARRVDSVPKVRPAEFEYHPFSVGQVTDAKLGLRVSREPTNLGVEPHVDWRHFPPVDGPRLVGHADHRPQNVRAQIDAAAGRADHVLGVGGVEVAVAKAGLG